MKQPKFSGSFSTSSRRQGILLYFFCSALWPASELQAVVELPTEVVIFLVFMPAVVSEWIEGSGTTPSVLRLIYQGRFLHSGTTLAGE